MATLQIPDDLHQRLADFGLCLPRTKLTFDQFATDYLKQHLKETGESSETNLRRTHTLLNLFFGPDIPIASVTPEIAKDFPRWLSEKHRNEIQVFAEATIAGHVKRAKQFFNAAVKSGHIERTPFVDVKNGSQVNEDRNVYVPHDIVDKVIDASHCAEMRLILALSRYGGLRVPVEARRMKWTDIDFEKNEMKIRGKKGPDGKVRRRVSPIFPQLKSRLVESFSVEDVYLVNRYRDTNPRTQVERLIKRADVDRWQRLFHNLRGSWETDLYDGGFGIQAVAKWLGHSPEMALRHYLKVTKTQHERASTFRVGTAVNLPNAENDSEPESATNDTTGPGGGTPNCGTYRIWWK